MVGPRDFSSGELERFGLGRVERRVAPQGTVTKLYCLRCGSEVSIERRDTDPEGWWGCARECNTRFAKMMGVPARHPVP